VTSRWSPLERVFRRAWKPGDARSQVEEELAFHLEEAAREHEALGMSPREARERVEAEFGDLDYTLEYCAEQTALRESEARFGMRMEEFFQDLGFTLRTLRKNWSYTAVVVVTLAFGIAANTLIFSVMNPYFFRDLPYEDADELVQLGFVDAEFDGYRFSLGQVEDWRERSQAIGDVGAYYYGTRNLTGPEGAQRYMTTFVTDNLFPLLGSEPLLGRTVLPGEGGPAGADVVMLAESLWRNRFGADPGTVGRTVEIDGVPHTVVGVMPHEFGFPFNEVRMWVPMREDAASQGRESNGTLPVVRLADGWSPERARTELNTILPDFAQVYPEQEGRFTGVSVKTMREALNFAWGPLRIAFTVLLVAVICVLLIACVNVASLTLARASTRTREVAVRAAVGAGRGRLLRQFLTESLVLAVFGGAVGVVLAYWGAEVLGPVIPEGLYRVGDVSIDGTVLAFTVLITLITPVAFGLVPALHATRQDLASTLKEGRGGSGLRGALRGRRLLVIGEVSLAIALIAATGLMVRSFSSAMSVDVGFDSDRIAVVEFTPPESGYAAGDEVEALFRQASEEFASVAGVESVGQTAWLPLNHETLQYAVSRPGQEPADRNDWPTVLRGHVSPNYFETMGIPVLQGRTFERGDAAEDPDIAVVSRRFQERFFPGENPVGQTVLLRTSEGSIPVRVVGVVDDIQYVDLESAPQPFLYRPITQAASRRRFVVARASGDNPAALLPQLRQAARTVDADLPVTVRIMDNVVQESTLTWALGSVFLGVFGVGALLLASLGIYGVISYSVSQRKREMGIRIAMGASTRDIRTVVVGEGLKLTGAGIAIGLVLAAVVGRLMASLLYGVSPFDPVTMGGVLALFVTVAAVASAMPAIRAGRTDPREVLTAE